MIPGKVDGLEYGEQVLMKWFKRVADTWRIISNYHDALAAYDRGEKDLALELLDKNTKIRTVRAREWAFRAVVHYFRSEYEDVIEALEIARERNESDKTHNIDEAAYLGEWIYWTARRAEENLGVKHGEWPSPQKYDVENVRANFRETFILNEWDKEQDIELES